MKFGEIILIPFPFTDLTKAKLRPALVVSNNNTQEDIIVAFVTSKNDQRTGGVVALKANKQNNLKGESFVRFNKLATLKKSLAVGCLGQASDGWLKQNKENFYKVFGF